jgi:hypothetical protein
MRNLILAFAFLVGASVTFSFACSLAILPLRDFDKSEFIFVGKVVDYTLPANGKDLRRPAVGLIVKVANSVYLPTTPTKHFEVFSFDLYADCSLAGQTAETLQINFPIGAEVLVVAKEAKHIARSTEPGVVRLEERPGELGAIVVNRDRLGKPLSDTSSDFEYRSLSTSRDQNSAAE